MMACLADYQKKSSSFSSKRLFDVIKLLLHKVNKLQDNFLEGSQENVNKI